MRKEYRILLIGFDFSLESGGIQNTGYLLAEEFSKYIDVFTFTPVDGNSPIIENIKSFRSHFLFRDHAHYNKDAKNIVESIHQQFHIDYILVLQYMYSEPAYYLYRKYNIRYGVMIHGNEIMKYPLISFFKNPYSSIKSLLNRRKLLNNAEKIFSNSNFTKELALKVCSNSNIFVIHPPIKFAYKPCNVNSLKTPIILSIGRLVERKGYQNIIRALPAVLRTIPNIKYVIAGDGNYKSQLIRIAQENGVLDSVEFKGHITEDEKDKLLSQCGLFVMPSLMLKEKLSVEGFGVAILEANSYGKFVIASLSGGIPEAVIDSKTGFLVKENSIETIANSILKFYNGHFSYRSIDCLNWAKEHQVSLIAKQYYEKIFNN